MIGKGLAALGGIIGAGSVIVGLLGEGGTAPYAARLAFAAVALVLALVAGSVPWWPRVSVRTAGIIMFPSGVVGFLATQLWFINTYYVAALPLWLIATVLLVAGGAVRR